MKVVHLNCGLKRSLKCVILAVFLCYSGSKVESLKKIMSSFVSPNLIQYLERETSENKAIFTASLVANSKLKMRAIVKIVLFLCLNK